MEGRKVIHVEGIVPTLPNVHYTRTAMHWARSGYIYSDGHRSLFSTIHKQEDWTPVGGVAPVAIGFFYQGANLNYDPAEAGLQVFGNWDNGVYSRENHILGAGIVRDDWKRFGVGNPPPVHLTFHDPASKRLFYETLKVPSMELSAESYKSFEFFKHLIVGQITDWCKLREILGTGRYEEVALSGGNLRRNAFVTLRPGLRVNSLKFLDLNGSILGNVRGRGLISLIPLLPNLEVLRVHAIQGIHKSDKINVYPKSPEYNRSQTREFAEVIGGLQHLHTLEFDMAYAGTNTAAGFNHGVTRGWEIAENIPWLPYFVAVGVGAVAGGIGGAVTDAIQAATGNPEP